MQRAGFTLLEMSIVLVLIGLITGGILFGRDLVHAGEVRSLLSDFKRYDAAIATFRTKYNAYPGDMPNATSIWGAVSTTPATCYATAGTGTQTCDGNGDGQIDAIGGTFAERHRFWQHLANAGLVSGKFTGIPADPLFPKYVLPGTNAPTSSYAGNAGFGVAYYNSPTTAGGLFPAVGNVLIYGATSSCCKAEAVYGAVTPSDAEDIDLKLDDGKPGSGAIIGSTLTGLDANCTTTDDPLTSQWDVAQKGYNCAVWNIVAN